MLSFLPLMKNSVTTGFNFLLLIISAIILSKTINTFLFCLDCDIQLGCIHHAYYVNIP